MANIDWNAFTPASALAGGVLIGAAAAAFLLLNGRTAGVSGVIGGLLRPSRGDVIWRVAFLAGLVAAPQAYAWFSVAPRLSIAADWDALISAGLLVGIGTRFASGCTSGHGVCGVARLSRRSWVATLIFTAAAFVTTFFMRHVQGA
ncbi:MAG: YeeE/YedE family protein [Burkholderiaceae bacterium]|nr:YeeE/YedE family protein [Burkholderiaceae bacterium]